VSLADTGRFQAGRAMGMVSIGPNNLVMIGESPLRGRALFVASLVWHAHVAPDRSPDPHQHRADDGLEARRPMNASCEEPCLTIESEHSDRYEYIVDPSNRYLVVDRMTDAPAMAEGKILAFVTEAEAALVTEQLNQFAAALGPPTST